MKVHLLAPFNLPGTGLVDLTVIGSNFGSQDYTPSLIVMRPNGVASCGFTRWVSESCIICKGPSGFGKDRQIVLQTFNTEITTEGILSFDIPSIVSIEPAHSPTSGHQEVWIKGKNFGKVNTKEIYCTTDEKNVTVCQTLGFVSSIVPRIFIGITECASARWFADDLVFCKTVEGTGHSLIVKVDVGNQTGYLSSAFTYHAPILLNTSKVVKSHEEIELTGSSFGFFSSTPKASVGLTPCEFTLYFSDSSLTCKVSSGLGQDLTVAITVGTSSQSNISCYLASQSSGSVDAQPLTELMAGGHADFCKHLSQMSAYGKFASYELARLSYSDAPNATNLNVSHGGFTRNIGPDATRNLVFVPGSTFGIFDSSVSARVGLTAATISHWASDSMILVKPSFGLSESLDLQLTIVHQRATFSRVFSYDVASIQDTETLLSSATDIQSQNTSFASIVQGINSPTLGNVYGAISLISGGITDSTPKARLGTAAHSTIWISETFVQLKVAQGSASGIDVAISIQGILKGGGTRCEVFSYDFPGVKYVSRVRDLKTLPYLSKTLPNFPSQGTVRFLISGSNFGGHANSLKSKLHVTASEFTVWRSDIDIYGNVPAGTNPSCFPEVIVTSDLRTSTMTEIFSYDSPHFSLLAPSNLPTFLGQWNSSHETGISISAINFGTAAYSLSSRVDGTSASHTLWISDTRINCYFARGVGKNWRVIVSMNQHYYEQSRTVSYDAVDLKSSNGTIWNYTLQYVNESCIKDHVIREVSETSCLNTTSGNSSCNNSYWYDYFSSRNWSSQSVFLELLPPALWEQWALNCSHRIVIQGESPGSNSALRGESSMSIDGASMSSFHHSPQARVGRTSALLTEWISDSTLTVKLGVGHDNYLLLAVTLAEQFGSLSDVFTYNAAVLEKILPPERPPAAPPSAAEITLFGSAFGEYDTSALISIGGTFCQYSRWSSDTSMICAVSNGVGVERDVLLQIQSFYGGLLQSSSFASFLHASIIDSIHVIGGANVHFVRIAIDTIIMGFQTDSNLPYFSPLGSSNFIIDGFLNSPTKSSENLQLSGRDAILFMNTTASWNQSYGRLNLSLAPGARLSSGYVLEVSFEIKNPSINQPPVKPVIWLQGRTPIPARRMDGFALNASSAPKFDYTFVNFSSPVLYSLTTLRFEFRPNTDMEQGSNITISGLKGSTTEQNLELDLQGPSASMFTSSYFINMTNKTYGLLCNGTVKGILDTNPRNIKLDACDCVKLGYYINIKNESRQIVQIISLASCTLYIDTAFTVVQAGFTIYNEPEYIISTGQDYAVHVSAPGKAVWLPQAGCTPMPANGQRICLPLDGSLLLLLNTKIPSDMIVVLEIVLRNSRTEQQAVTPSISATGFLDFELQSMDGNALLANSYPSFPYSSVQSSSVVKFGINTITVSLSTNADIEGPAVLNVEGIQGIETVDSTSILLKGSNSSLFTNSIASWNQQYGRITCALDTGSYIKGVGNLDELIIASPGWGYENGRLYIHNESGQGFKADFMVNSEGSIKRINIHSAGYGYFTDVSFDFYFANRDVSMTFTITKVYLMNDLNSFYMHGCSVPGTLSAVAPYGSGFQGFYQVADGAISDVWLSNNGQNYLTRPSLVTNNSACRCGSGIDEVVIVDAGANLTSTGRLQLSALNSGSGFAASFSAFANGSMSQVTIEATGSGYTADVMDWVLLCFDDKNSIYFECSGGVKLEFLVGKSSATVGGMDSCVGFYWANSAEIYQASRVISFNFSLRNNDLAIGQQTITMSLNTSTVAIPKTIATSLIQPSSSYPRFLINKIGSKSSVSYATNLLTVTLLPNGDLLPGEKITISGLVGSTTPSSLIEISQRDQIFVRLAPWNNGDGSIVLTIAKDKTMPSDVATVLTFQLRNSELENYKAVAYIENTLDGNWEKALRNLTKYSDGFMPIERQCMSMDTFDIDEMGRSILACTFDATNLPCCNENSTSCCSLLNGKTKPYFWMKNISSSSSILGAITTITVSLAATATIGAPSEITLSGFKAAGFKAANISVDNLDLGGPNAGTFTSSRAIWIEEAGNVTLSFVGSQTLAVETPTIFSFQLRNPYVQNVRLIAQMCCTLTWFTEWNESFDFLFGTGLWCDIYH
eukprot:768667-Hanusia_phi.AAC.3